MEKKSLTIMTWNLRKNGGVVLLPQIYSALKPDILLLQECKRPNLEGSIHWQDQGHHDKGSAVVCRSGEIEPIDIPGYEGWVVGGRLVGCNFETGDRPLSVFSIHAPTGNTKRKRRNYVLEVESILGYLEENVLPHSNIILGGDFNFISLGQRLEVEDLRTSGPETRALQKLSALGLVSCWTSTHRDQALAQTLRWSNDPTKAFHCDGIFVPAEWTGQILCEIMTSDCFKVSDHNPVIAWIPV